jgi:hypothetical protein
MGGSDQELYQLKEELHAAIHEFDQKLSSMTSLYVLIQTGARRRRIFYISTQSLSWIINILNLTCFTTGFIFAFLGGAISTVGIALLVGALFSEGAFVGQMWTLAAQNRSDISNRLWGDDMASSLTQLKDKIADLSQRVDRFDQEEVADNTD